MFLCIGGSRRIAILGRCAVHLFTSSLLFLLTATCALAEEQLKLEESELSVKQAAQNAVISLPYYLSKPYGKIAKYPLLINKLTANNLPASGDSLVNLLVDNATPIYDIDGRLLIWSFHISLKDGNELTLQSAANTAIGSPVVSVMVTKPKEQSDLGRRLQLATDLAKESVSGVKLPGRYVVTTFPRTGLLFETKNNRRIVVDLDHLRIYEVRPRADRRKWPNPNVWSPYDWLTIKQLSFLIRLFDSALKTRAMSGPTMVEEDCVELSSLHRFEQEYGVWCAAATAQMILDFHGLNNLEQYDIAVAVNPPPRDLFFSMATDDGEVSGYREILDEHGLALAPEYFSPADFSGVQSEINADHPVRVAVHGHVVAIGGWKVAPTTRQVLVYDPSPFKPDPYYVEWDTLLYGESPCANPNECDMIFVR